MCRTSVKIRKHTKSFTRKSGERLFCLLWERVPSTPADALSASAAWDLDRSVYAASPRKGIVRKSVTHFEYRSVRYEVLHPPQYIAQQKLTPSVAGDRPTFRP